MPLISRVTSTYTLCILLSAMFVGCAGNYGSLKHSEDTFDAFVNDRLPTSYKYYYFGHHNVTVAIAGVDPQYEAGTRMWREIDPQSEEFKRRVLYIWDDIGGIGQYGADILDPSGKRVGVIFSSVSPIVIQFKDDNRIALIPHTPFLWGPGDPGGSAATDMRPTVIGAR